MKRKEGVEIEKLDGEKRGRRNCPLTLIPVDRIPMNNRIFLDNTCFYGPEAYEQVINCGKGNPVNLKEFSKEAIESLKKFGVENYSLKITLSFNETLCDLYLSRLDRVNDIVAKTLQYAFKMYFDIDINVDFSLLGTLFEFNIDILFQINDVYLSALFVQDRFKESQFSNISSRKNMHVSVETLAPASDILEHIRFFKQKFDIKTGTTLYNILDDIYTHKAEHLSTRDLDIALKLWKQEK